MLKLTENSIFLKDLYEEFSKNINNEDFTVFSKLKNDFERFEFVYKLPITNKYRINICGYSKSLPEAKLLKEKGNNAFQKGDFTVALMLYTQSLLKSPLEKENGETSIIRANRSAALFHLNKYKSALADIEAALSNGYPKDIIYKLKDRRARCLLALKQHKSGLTALKETLVALDDAKLPLERRLKWQKDIQIMIALMTKNKAQDEKLSVGTKEDKNFKRNTLYNSASDAIEIKYNQTAGRYAEAKRSIKVGEVLLCEDAYCAVLLEQKAKTHCFQCMKRTTSAEPCHRCDRVIFCSIKCQEKAQKTHHSVECKFLESLWKSGLSITCLMALRIISQKKPSYFMEMREHLLNDDMDKWTDGKYDNTDYRRVSRLVTHSDKRTSEALLHKTFIAVYLFRCLKEGSYFEGISNKDEKDYFKLIGGLLLTNLQLVQFNSHEISELECPKIDLNSCRSQFIGGGLYPTLALFNHSCNPGLIRYYDGAKVIARAIRPIKFGEMVGENYGPIFTEMPKDLRRKELKQQYWFDCECEACAGNWPLLKNMDSGSLRFRCDNKTCSNVLVVPNTTTEFIITCSKCNSHTNILKGLKVLQDSENMFRLAQSMMTNGDIKKALVKYKELLDLLDEVLVPPFRDYHICQQGLRTCYITNGNTYKAYEQ